MTELENRTPKTCAAIPKRTNRLSLLQSTRFVRKLSSHFEYLEKRLCGHHVTWQPVTWDPSVIIRQWETPLTELVYCVTATFTVTEWADQLHNNNVPAHYTALVQVFFCKTSHHPGLSAPVQPRFGPLRLPAFSRAKNTIDREEICKCYGHTVRKPSQ